MVEFDPSPPPLLIQGRVPPSLPVISPQKIYFLHPSLSFLILKFVDIFSTRTPLFSTSIANPLCYLTFRDYKTFKWLLELV